jgi:hypothetical protein
MHDSVALKSVIYFSFLHLKPNGQLQIQHRKEINPRKISKLRKDTRMPTVFSKEGKTYTNFKH